MKIKFFLVLGVFAFSALRAELEAEAEQLSFHDSSEGWVEVTRIPGERKTTTVYLQPEKVKHKLGAHEEMIGGKHTSRQTHAKQHWLRPIPQQMGPTARSSKSALVQKPKPVAVPKPKAVRVSKPAK